MRRRARGGRALWFAVAIVAAAAGDPTSLRAQDPRAESIVEIRLGPQHEQHRRRIDNAANESLARLSEWLGPVPDRHLVIADRQTLSESRTMIVEIPWRPVPSTMDLESQVSYGLAQLWWPGPAENREALPVVNGIAWYLQSRVVERLFDFAFLNPGHSADAVRFFGGAVPWEFPLLRMSRWTSGLGRPEFLRGGAMRDWPVSARRLPASLDLAAIRVALAFGSLERYIGWPALQGALFESARRAPSGSMSLAQLLEGIGTAAGQDLSWLFEAALDATRPVDYAVASVSSAPCSNAPCVVTKVTAARLGNGVFSGASRAPRGSYDSGDAIELRVAFADGQQVDTRWDGRAPSRDFEFESPAPPSGVHLDPNRVVLLDSNTLNNDRLASSRTNVPIGKWVSRWVVWLQDATLGYASLF